MIQDKSLELRNENVLSTIEMPSGQHIFINRPADDKAIANHTNRSNENNSNNQKSNNNIVIQKNDIALLISNADKLVRHKEFELAKGLIYKALAIDSNHPAALRLAEKILHPIRDVEQIIKIRQIIYKVDYCFQSAYSLADAYYKVGNDSLAKKFYLESLQVALDGEADFFEIYKNLGNILTRDGDYDGAEEYYHRAYAIQPESDVLLVNLGTLELQQNEYNEAISRFRKALSINKKSDKAWVGLALVHHQMGDTELAYANIENAIELNPTNRTAVHVYANWAFRDGKYYQAIQVLQKYISNHEGPDEEMSLIMVQLLSQINRFDLAYLEAERVLLWNPKNEKMIEVEKQLRQLLGKK